MIYVSLPLLHNAMVGPSTSPLLVENRCLHERQIGKWANELERHFWHTADKSRIYHLFADQVFQLYLSRKPSLPQFREHLQGRKSLKGLIK